MRHRRLLVQVGVAAVLLGLLALLVNNLAVNLIRTGLGLGFTWLGRPAGFALAETALPYSPSDSYLWACLLYTSPSPRDRTRSRMPSSA